MIHFEKCPVGMFTFDGELCLNTEYELEAYIVSSGERFWGGVNNLEQLRHVMVCPVEVEPVRHGKNVTATHPSDMFVCSECGFTCEITELRYGDDGMGEPDAYEYDCNYCPNCGAKMDAEVEHENA